MPKVTDDPVHQEAKDCEDDLFQQRQFVHDLDESDPRKARFDVTAQASHSSLLRQQRLEKAFGTPAWTAAKIEAIEGNRRARQVFEENLATGIGGWNSGGGRRHPF